MGERAATSLPASGVGGPGPCSPAGRGRPPPPPEATGIRLATLGAADDGEGAPSLSGGGGELTGGGAYRLCHELAMGERLDPDMRLVVVEKNGKG
ncbi:hypothetical protein ACP4OV_026367 [Aristida adscensionis]